MLTESQKYIIRFERAIYLHYVETNQYKQFKKVSKDEFFHVYGSRLSRYKDFGYDKNDIYRLADCKTVWYDKFGAIVGESWHEEKLSSYWIKKD